MADQPAAPETKIEMVTPYMSPLPFNAADLFKSAKDTQQKPGADVPAGFPQDVTIVQGEDKAAQSKSAPLQPGLPPNFHPLKGAEELQTALFPPGYLGLKSADSDKVWNKLLNMSPQEFQAVERDFNQNYGPQDKSWFSGTTPTLKDVIKDRLGSDSERFLRLIESKSQNEVPPEHQVNGHTLLKEGSNLKVGEINEVNLPDGRRYDVYIPKNADNRAPVTIAMHGAAGGDSTGLMASESGITADAERTGSIVVFAYPEKQKYDSKFGAQDGVAWHAPDRTNLPSAKSSSDDEKYLDNVITDLGSKATTSSKVGLLGFSDGGRFAQVYAADRPDKVAAVVSEDGTWMKGDKKPTSPLPALIIHGDQDETLPYKGGTGSVSGAMDWALGTNLDKSAPYMQAQVWKEADSCTGPDVTSRLGNVEIHQATGCKSGEVSELILKGGHHAINDYKNDGNHFVQWLLGSPDRNQEFVTIGSRFLTKHIVSDADSEKRPQ